VKLFRRTSGEVAQSMGSGFENGPGNYLFDRGFDCDTGSPRRAHEPGRIRAGGDQVSSHPLPLSRPLVRPGSEPPLDNCPYID
jgi:hypothetical protein